MGCYIDGSGKYYIGSKDNWQHQEVPERPSIYHDWSGGEWAINNDRRIDASINALQETYVADRESLNKAWLSALIADGPNEASRQAILAAQMTALDAQLDADIEAIFIGG